jgi:hypothetical protein
MVTFCSREPFLTALASIQLKLHNNPLPYIYNKLEHCLNYV